MLTDAELAHALGVTRFEASQIPDSTRLAIEALVTRLQAVERAIYAHPQVAYYAEKHGVRR